MILINRDPTVIVGVTPPGFAGTVPAARAPTVAFR
jgi:hypothetical protein